MLARVASLVLPGGRPGRRLAWGMMRDVEFGLQFFPNKNSDPLSCDVAAQPEVPPAPGMQVTIIKQMLEMLPFGFSPDVAIMESVAAAPGRLADPTVLGTVVLLSDGGDNCSGDTQAQIVQRLGAAAKKLFDAGVKTYAIRFGSNDSETAEQAEQMTAIVQNGGTAARRLGRLHRREVRR